MSTRTQKEIRTHSAPELRKSTSGKLEGKIPYGSKSSWLGFYETLKPGCFAASLRSGQEVVANWSHDMNAPVGRQSIAAGNPGSLVISDRSDALYYTLTPTEADAGRNLLTMADEGLVKSTSFEFSVNAAEDEEWSLLPDGTAHRLIKKASLWSVSPCLIPAYPASSLNLAARSALRWAPSEVLAVIQRNLDPDDSTDDDGDVVDDADSCDCPCDRCQRAVGIADEVSGCEVCTGDDNGDCAFEECSNCPIQAASEHSAHLVAVLNRARILLDE